MSIKLHIEPYPDLVKYRFYPEDLKRPGKDLAVEKFYSNDETEVYLRHGSGSAAEQ